MNIWMPYPGRELHRRRFGRVRGRNMNGHMKNATCNEKAKPSESIFLELRPTTYLHRRQLVVPVVWPPIRTGWARLAHSLAAAEQYFRLFSFWRDSVLPVPPS